MIYLTQNKNYFAMMLWEKYLELLIKILLEVFMLYQELERILLWMWLFQNFLYERKTLFSADFTGIYGKLLIDGSNFSCQTNAPLDPTEDMVLGFDRNTLLWKNIFESDVIFLDEGSQFHKYYIEELHWLLK